MRPITVMTWNVRYFGHGLKGLSSTEGGMRRVASALASLEALPDLIALQEVETRSFRAGLGGLPQLERFLRVLDEQLEERGRPERFTGLYYPAHRYKLGPIPPVYTTGLAMLVGVRLEVDQDNADAPHDITHVRIPSFRRLKQRRVVAHARVRLRGTTQTLDVFNTHMSLPAFFEVGPTKVSERMGDGSNQVAEVRALLDYVAARRAGAAVIVGDFNTRPGSPTYQEITTAGFTDAFARANDLDEAALHDHATAGFAHRRMHIDHMFSSSDVTWARVDSDRFGMRGRFHGISDHTPKIGQLTLTG